MSVLDTADTLIHEALHAEFPDLTEDAVDSIATKIARLLKSAKVLAKARRKRG